MKGRGFLTGGGILMIVLGLARGAGGAILLVLGSAADPGIRASQSSVVVLGGFLVMLGAGLIASAVGVLRRRRSGWIWGVGLVIAFVIDGALNGYVLFGRPGDQGTVINVCAAAVIIVCLHLGRHALAD